MCSTWQLGEPALGSFQSVKKRKRTMGKVISLSEEWWVAFNRDVTPHCSQQLLGMAASFGQEWGDWLVSSMGLGFGRKEACASSNCFCNSLVAIVLLLFSLNRPCYRLLWILISPELGVRIIGPRAALHRAVPYWQDFSTNLGLGTISWSSSVSFNEGPILCQVRWQSPFLSSYSELAEFYEFHIWTFLLTFNVFNQLAYVKNQ